MLVDGVPFFQSDQVGQTTIFRCDVRRFTLIPSSYQQSRTDMCTFLLLLTLVIAKTLMELIGKVHTPYESREKLLTVQL